MLAAGRRRASLRESSVGRSHFPMISGTRDKQIRLMTEYYSQYYTVPRSRSYSKCGVVIEYSYSYRVSILIRVCSEAQAAAANELQVTSRRREAPLRRSTSQQAP